MVLGDVKLDGIVTLKAELLKSYPSAQLEIVEVDITKEDSVQNIVDHCVTVFGRLDYAINIAGVVPQRLGITELDTSVYDWTVNTNEFGVSVTPIMRSS